MCTKKTSWPMVVWPLEMPDHGLVDDRSWGVMPTVERPDGNPKCTGIEGVS